MAMSSEFWAAIFGALLGAVVGGLITFLLQLHAQRRAAATRETDRHETRKALAHAILFKLIKIHSRFKIFSDHIENAFAEAEAAPFQNEPWQFVRAVATNPSHVLFTADEMTLLITLKEDDLFNGILSLDDAHNTMVDLFDLYRSKRDELTHVLPPQAFVGEIGSATLTAEEVLPYRPLMIEANGLVTAMRPWALKDAHDTEALIRSAQKAFGEKLGMKYRLKIRDEEVDEKPKA